MKQLLIKLAKYLMIPVGIVHSLARPAGPIRILMYHRVNDHVAKELSVTNANFRWQMECLIRKGYRVISLDDAIQLCSAPSQKRGKYVVLTFDDGYEDFIFNAYPVLCEYNYPCIIYLVPGYMESGKVYWWDKDLGESRLMDWKQVESMQNGGLIQFGSHTMTHADLDRLDEKETREELILSKEVLQNRLNTEIRHFSYPRGIVTEYARELAGTIYKTAVSIFRGEELRPDRDPDLAMLKRIPVQRSDGRHLYRARLNGWLIAEEWIRKAIGRH